jgi:hypothetical protein
MHLELYVRGTENAPAVIRNYNLDLFSFEKLESRFLSIIFSRRLISHPWTLDDIEAVQEDAAWMIPPWPPGPSAGGPGGFGLGAARGRVAPAAPSLGRGSALVVARMSCVGRDDTYRTSWSRKEGEGDNAINSPWWQSILLSSKARYKGSSSYKELLVSKQRHPYPVLCIS